MSTSQRIETVIVGGGQAGLAVGYYLARRGRPFVILEAADRIGSAWRSRWDSLRLFTPAKFDGLPGMRFPGPRNHFPTKDEMATFLETYADRFRLPVRLGTRVESLSRDRDRFVVSCDDVCFEATNVVVAMANYQGPRIPPFAAELDPAIVQLHSSAYRNPAQLADGAVLVVGAGNSGAELAMEAVRSHPTFLAGQESGHVPFHIDGFVARHALLHIVRFVGQHVLTVRTPIGRRAREKLIASAGPLIRVKPKDLTAAGVERVGRVAGVRSGRPVVEGERALEVTNVIWSTGYHTGFSWIDLPVFANDGQPIHERGVVPSEPGLYFVGLKFLSSMTSDTITGISRDARYIATRILKRQAL